MRRAVLVIPAPRGVKVWLKILAKTTSLSSWWLNQPVWNICWSHSIISPGFGVKIKQHLKPPNLVVWSIRNSLRNSTDLLEKYHPRHYFIRWRTDHWWIQYLFQHSYVPRWVSKKDRDATVAIAATYSSLMNRIQQNRWYPPRTSPVFSYWNFTYPNSPCPSHMTHLVFWASEPMQDNTTLPESPWSSHHWCKGGGGGVNRQHCGKLNVETIRWFFAVLPRSQWWNQTLVDLE